MTNLNNTHFYRDLPLISSFTTAADGTQHEFVPADWWVVVADVEGSTQAIEAGDYKKVNTVGVACIAAVMNVDKSIDLPFIFGGDGATFAIPDTLLEGVVKALRAAQQLSKETFGLNLRVGLVRVATLVTQGFWVRIAKMQLSPNVTQPVLSGRGWEEAERRVKAKKIANDAANDMTEVLHVRMNEGVAEGSFEGFECRWQNIPSFNDHKLALLVAATSSQIGDNFKTFEDLLATIQYIYGEVAEYHPLRADRMKLCFKPKTLSYEWRVRTAHLPIWQRLTYFANMYVMYVAGRIIFAKKMDTEAVKWSRYLDDLVDNSDFRKFDGMLRMVIDGTNAQAKQLEDYLKKQHLAGKLVFGMRQSPEALMTCIVQSYNGNHLHFIDGSNGGYALAAQQLKQQLKAALAHK